MKKRAFTLIELLVVIAIIVLLISILVPSLKRVKELARTAQCATYQRKFGNDNSLFANENQNFMVGSGNTSSPIQWNTLHFGKGSQTFANFLNLLLYGRETYQRSGFSQKMAIYDDNTPLIYCPTMKEWSGDRKTVFGYSMNVFANGASWTNYGKWVFKADTNWKGESQTPTSNWRAIREKCFKDAIPNDYTKISEYRYGANLSRFNNPASTYLLRDSRNTSTPNFQCLSGATDTPEAVLLNNSEYGVTPDPEFPPWVNYTSNNRGGTWSFRHVGEKANALYADGHVVTHGSDDKLVCKSYIYPDYK